MLWPRIVLPRGAGEPDASLRALARDVQTSLASASRGVFPPAKVDVRPAPERVCPRAGCKAVSVGALLTRAGKGCAVLALVSGPGESPATIVPWAGVVQLDRVEVPFREPPERQVQVDDYVRCTDLGAAMRKNAGRIEEAVRKARDSNP